MFKRIFAIWAAANFVFVGLASLIAGEWYLTWNISLASKMAVEIGLIILPNLLFPFLALRYWIKSDISPRIELAWQWRGKKSLVAGIGGFVFIFMTTKLTSYFLGEGIPYQLPETSSQNSGLTTTTPVEILLVLLGLCLFVALTAVGEETMFRGLVQTQVGKRYGDIIGILSAALLFGLRHLPNDIFYARIWQATPQMWLSRQIQLYLGALIFGLTRHYGKSTAASSISHGLYLIVVLLGLG